jgi:hypothetical protein
VPEQRTIFGSAVTVIGALQGFARVCKSPIFKRVFFPGRCPVLHHIAFPVVSEWCQYHPCIRVTLSFTSGSFEFKTSELHPVRLTGEPQLLGPFRRRYRGTLEDPAKGALLA